MEHIQNSRMLRLMKTNKFTVVKKKLNNYLNNYLFN